MKNLIQRNLPLNINYTLIDKKYIPLENSVGTCCDNCGKLIANIATIKSEDSKVYNIGFDCLETILINNSLLNTNDIKEYELVKKMIPKVLRFSKHIKTVMNNNVNNNITGLLFEIPTDYNWHFYTFYWLTNNKIESRDNDYVKIKEMDFDFLIKTLKNIFPKIDIITK